MQFSFAVNRHLVGVTRVSALLGWGVFILLSATSPTYSATTVGATPGSHQVSPSGAFTYTIPIAVPPGVAGIEPKLSLAYNSQGGNGLLGMGWSLSGLSVIHRCPKTVAQDGILGGVNYDANDRYCLDGQRLVAISGAYGADATEYRTESESYSRIISYGSQGSGPASWKVWTKSGQIIEYGNTTDSRIEVQGKTEVMLWALSKLSDTVSNYLTVTYIEDNPNGQYYPDRIDYTGNANAAKSSLNSMRFVYETRPDIVPAYHAGSLNKATVRLTNMQSYAGATLSRDYRLAYEQSPATQWTRLVSMTECTSGDTCLAPTVFAWSGSSEISFGPTVESPFVAGDTSTANNAFDVGDFNGDGFVDPVKTAGATIAKKGSATGELAGDITGPAAYPRLLVGDLNGDGVSDVIRWTGEYAGRIYFYVYTARSNGVLAVVGPVGIASTLYSIQLRGNLSWIQLKDVNGDGLADLLWYTEQPTNSGLYVALAKSGGRFATNGKGTLLYFYDMILETVTCQSAGCDQNVWFDSSELNGDSSADGVRYDAKTGNLHAWLSLGNGRFNGNIVSNFVAGGTKTDRHFTLADVNGDGIGDAVLYVPATGELTVALALGDGRFGAPFTTSFIAGGTPDDHWFLMVDMNGDGKADAVKFDPATGNLSIARSQGDGSFDPPVTIPFLAGGTPADRWFRIADINGDGYPDAVLHVPGSNKVQVLPSSRQALDVVNTLTNGLGATTTVTYKPLTDASVYAKDTTAVYPYVDIQASMYVAASVSASDGTGGNAVANYTYAGAKSHQLGGGFLGFRQISAHDPQTRIRSTTTYRQDHPYHGQPLTSQKVTDSGVLLSQSTITYTDQLLNTGLSSTWHQSMPIHTVESSYELTGGLISTVITDTQYDSYGNPTSIVVNSGGGYSKTTTNIYDNVVDPDRWFLGRLRRSTVNSVTP